LRLSVIVAGFLGFVLQQIVCGTEGNGATLSGRWSMRALAWMALGLTAALWAGLFTAQARAQVEGTSQAKPAPSLTASNACPDSEGAEVSWGDLWDEGPAAGHEGSSSDVFHAGRQELQATVGPYFSTPLMGAKRPYLHGYTPNPTLDFLPINLRLGTMLNTPDPDRRFLRGNFEIIGELWTAPALNGYAHIAVGPDIMLRYNFVSGDCRLVPYIQGAAGIVYNDGYRDKLQDTIGAAVEFSLQTQAGCRYLLSDNWSMEVEGGFLHISNGDLARRNGGYNSFGGSIGISYHFPVSWH
jgi:hypothetical protein